MNRMRTPLLITVREDGTTYLPGHVSGFPVDGDALHPGGEKKKRAENLIVSSPNVLATARTWLGKPLHPSDPEQTPVEVARHISRIYPGGASRFIADGPRNLA